jgi:hypothetical protein
MLRLIVSCPAESGLQPVRSFDLNLLELEQLLQQHPGQVAIQGVEVLEGRKRAKPKPKPKASAEIKCPDYERFLAIYHEELVDWVPPEGSEEMAPDLDPVSERYGNIWVQRREWMDTIWTMIMTTSTRAGKRRATTDEEAYSWWREYCRRARRDNWLMGRENAPGPHSKWRATFDFLVREKNWRFVIERREQ